MRPYVSVVVVVCLFVCLFVVVVDVFCLFFVVVVFCFFLASSKSRDRSRTFSDIIMAHILHG